MNGWIWWLIAGMASLAGGLFALAHPLGAILTSVLLTGYLFMAVGVLMLMSIFGDPSWRSRLLSLLLGLAVLFIGINIVSNPLRGVLSLTVLVAIMMLVIGVLRMVFAFGLPTPALRAVLILSGLGKLWVGRGVKTDAILWGVIGAGGVSVVLALLVLFGATPQLGHILSLEVLADGVALVVMALRLERPAAKA